MNSKEQCFEATGTTARTRKHIKGCLKKQLKDTYNREDLYEEFLKIQGLDDSKFDYIDSVANMIYTKLSGKAVQDCSIDHNANRSSSAITAVHTEADAPMHKLVGYDFLYRQLKENVGKKEANRIMSLIYDYSLAVNDATKLLMVYCWALNGAQLVMEGRKGSSVEVSPAKHLLSYINMLLGTMQQLSSSSLAGAVACGSMFTDICRILLTEGYTKEDIENNEELRHEVKQMYQTFVYSAAVDEIRDSAECMFSNLSIFDREKLRGIVEDMDWYFYDTGKEVDYIIEFIIVLQDLYMDFMDIGDPVTGIPFTFPVNTVNIAKNDSGEIIDMKFVEDFCKRPVHKYNIMVSAGSKIASCCRLSSNADLLKYAGSMNSFGGGGAGNLGSHRVVVINTNRAAILATSEEDFYVRVSMLISDATDILRAHKDMLIKLESIGLQPAITNGLININRLFSTYGVIATWETCQTLDRRFGKDPDRDIKLATFINVESLKFGAKSQLLVNQEQIPAESMAVRLAKADRMLFGDKYVPCIYSNQAIPLTEDVDVFERMDRWGRLDKAMTGGGIVHLTINEPVSSEQALHMIKYSVRSGSEHFAFNLLHSKCLQGHIVEGKFEQCPECGAEVIDYALRVVGFLRWTSSWSKERQEEFKDRKINKLDF